MPRIPYVPANLNEPHDVVQAIRQRRGGSLTHLDRMLLHSPPFANGWNALLGRVRTGLSLDPLLRELAICTVARLTRADYEWFHHAPEFLKAGGTGAQLDAIRSLDPDTELRGPFDPRQTAVIGMAADMTLHVEVRPEVFDRFSAAIPDRVHQVELIGTIAVYNMVSRFLVATGVEPEPDFT